MGYVTSIFPQNHDPREESTVELQDTCVISSSELVRYRSRVLSSRVGSVMT